jgi:hypothetical protein
MHFAEAPFRPFAPGREGDSVGNFEEPGSEGVAPGYASRVTCQCEKRSLKRVLGVVRILQDAPAYPIDKPRVPPNEQLEGRLVTARDEAIEELDIAGAADFCAHLANPSKDRC